MTEPREREPPKKILLVDDETPLRLLVLATLENSGYELLEAANGKEAIEVALRVKPDLVLLDVALPEMDGFEVCCRLRAMPETCRSTIIMLTAMGQEADRRRGREVGADDYLVKPFSPIALLAKVDQALKETRSKE